MLVVLIVLALLVGCGGGNGSGSTGESATALPEGNGRTPQRTEVATVYLKPRPGIPADRGQWMVDIPVDPDGDLGFTVAKVIAPPGNANFRLLSPTPIDHDLTIREVGGGSISTKPVHEGSEWLRVSLFADKHYVFYCSLDGHREAGMEGIIEADPRLEADDLKTF